MRKYELALVLPPKGEEKDRESVINKVKGEVEKMKGKIEKIDSWGKRELSYPIKRFEEGYFYILELSFPEETINDFEKKIRPDDGIIRHLLVKTDN